MLSRNVLIGLISLILYTGLPVRVFADINPPRFPTCLNPQGVIRASYDNGQHGIAGSIQTYTGADVVYQFSDYGLMQCFCDPNGLGIQTNWWKVSKLDANQISSFKNLGWIFEPQGMYWGLDNDPYLAQNSNYACKAQQTAIIDGSTNTSTGSTNSSTSAGNNSSNTGNAIGQVTSLAFTGNILIVSMTLITGVIFLIAGILLRKQK